MRGIEMRTVFKIRHGSMFNRKAVDLVAVNDVSLSVRIGETLGIVGESGSGKSTLGMSLIRLQRATAGQIEFNGKRIDDLDKRGNQAPADGSPGRIPGSVFVTESENDSPTDHR